MKGLKAHAVVKKDGSPAPEDKDGVLGRWVLPSFHEPAMFTADQVFRPCGAAIVTEGFDSDECLDSFVKEFPGIPSALISAVIVKLVVAVEQDKSGCFAEGAIVRFVGDLENGSLISVASQKTLPLWNDVSLTKYL